MREDGRDDDTFDARAFRQCLSAFATGVTVITASDDAGQLAGITVNSFSSVSLDPPLILWSLGLSNSSLQHFRDSTHFVVNVLSSEQRWMSDQFARPHTDKWRGVEYRLNDWGSPVLAGVMAALHCEKVETVLAGDHVICIGRVRRIEQRDGLEPLLFFKGDYRSIQCLQPRAVGVPQVSSQSI